MPPVTVAALHGANGSGAKEQTAGIDDLARLGALLDVAHTQQQLVNSALTRLEAHTRGVDAIVRDEIRQTFISECVTLEEEVSKTVAALQRMQRLATLRMASWGVALMVMLCSALVLAINHMLPSADQLADLRAQRARLSRQVEQLEDAGGRIDLRRCGPKARWCVRVDRSAPGYGPDNDFLIVKGD